MQHSKELVTKNSVVSGLDENVPWALPFTAVSQRVVKLELPTMCINKTLARVCRVLPGLRDLVLHVGASAETGDCTLSEESEAFAQSQLHTLTLSVPPGKPPFCLVSCEFVALLDLTCLPQFGHLVLRGPIVKDGFGEEDNPIPFIVQPHAKVRMCGRAGGAVEGCI